MALSLYGILDLSGANEADDTDTLLQWSYKLENIDSRCNNTREILSCVTKSRGFQDNDT